jgi:hypothetical protein
MLGSNTNAKDNSDLPGPASVATGMSLVIDTSDAPEPICVLMGWLDQQGFRVTAHESAGRNNQFAEYVAGRRRVKVTADRGEWSLGLGLVGWGESYDPDEWEAWLDGRPLVDASALERQVAFITKRWALAIDRASRHPDAEAQVRAIGADYVERRFGWRGDG